MASLPALPKQRADIMKLYKIIGWFRLDFFFMWIV